MCHRRHDVRAVMEWMWVKRQFQGHRFTSKKRGEAGPAAPQPSSAQTS